MPIGIYRAITAADDNVRLALVNGLKFTVPSHDVAFVRHMTPLGVPLLVSLTRWHVRAKGPCQSRSKDKRRFESECPHARQFRPIDAQLKTGPAICGQVAHETRATGAADRGEYRQAAGISETLIRVTPR